MREYINKIVTTLLLMVIILAIPNCAYSQQITVLQETEISEKLPSSDSADKISSHDSLPKITPREFNICTTPYLSSSKFNAKQLIVPGVFMVTGIIGALDNDNNLNLSIKDAMTDLSGDSRCKVDDYLRFVPSAAHLLMGSIGIKSKHNFKERFLISATAHMAMIAMSYGMKYTIHEHRPDMSDNHSFPSGHVALAFTGAELLRMEYGNIYGTAGYVIATGVAFLRLYNNRHWLNDVLMGAGIGILSARIGNWLLPFERKLFKINEKTSSTASVAVTPFYIPKERACIVSINAIF